MRHTCPIHLQVNGTYGLSDGGKVLISVGECRYCQGFAGEAVVGADPLPPFHRMALNPLLVRGRYGLRPARSRPEPRRHGPARPRRGKAADAAREMVGPFSCGLFPQPGGFEGLGPSQKARRLNLFPSGAVCG